MLVGGGIEVVVVGLGEEVESSVEDAGGVVVVVADCEAGSVTMLVESAVVDTFGDVVVVVEIDDEDDDEDSEAEDEIEIEEDVASVSVFEPADIEDATGVADGVEDEGETTEGERDCARGGVLEEELLSRNCNDVQAAVASGIPRQQASIGASRPSATSKRA